MYIKVRNGYLKLETNKLVFTRYSYEKINIIINYNSESIFKISINNLFLKTNLTLDEEGDSFYLEETNLFSNNQLVYENVYFFENSSSPLIEAIRGYDYFLVKKLIESGQIFPNCVDKYGLTFLMHICMDNSKEILETLLRNNLNDSSFRKDLEIQDNDGYTALMYICMYDNRKELLELLLREKVITRENLEIQDNYGYIALMFICRDNRKELLVLLLREKLISRRDLEIQNNNGNTAFMFICMYNRKELLEILLRENLIYKSDLEIKNNEGKTALNYAKGDIRNMLLNLF